MAADGGGGDGVAEQQPAVMTELQPRLELVHAPDAVVNRYLSQLSIITITYDTRT